MDGFVQGGGWRKRGWGWVLDYWNNLLGMGMAFGQKGFDLTSLK